MEGEVCRVQCAEYRVRSAEYKSTKCRVQYLVDRLVAHQRLPHEEHEVRAVHGDELREGENDLQDRAATGILDRGKVQSSTCTDVQ